MFFLSFMLVTAGAVTAQVRSVTNADLEKYRQQRIKAEKELNENYAKMGFSSPEVRAKRNADSQKEMFALSERLKADALAREQAQAELEREAAEQARYDALVRSLADQRNQQVYDPGFLYNGYYSRGWNRWWPRQQPLTGGWRATGGGLIYEPSGKSSMIWDPRVNLTGRPRPH
ncbi:MAG: hypothetical protein JO053_00375 [Acidobacteria bacterium]|nr:hypothetical protein [Acidobacteriota bacterium]